MKQGLDKIMDTAGRAMEAAMETTGKVVNKGRDKVETYALQSKLSKAQKQLGALVYMLHKTGQENQPMVEHYIKEIDNIKMQLSIMDVPDDDQPQDSVTVHECSHCGQEVLEDAMFCGGCGAQLP